MVSRYDAYCALLAMPDPPDLPLRGARKRLSGHPRRFSRYATALPLAYLQWQLETSGRPFYGPVQRMAGRQPKLLPFRRQA